MLTRYKNLQEVPKKVWVANDIPKQVYPLINYPAIYSDKPDYKEYNDNSQPYGLYYEGNVIGILETIGEIEEGACFFNE